MKYLFVGLLLGLGSVFFYSNKETNETRIKRQVAEFCSCHKGVDVFVYLPDDFMGYLEVQCKDGTQMNNKGRTDTIELGGGDNCQD